MVAALAGYAVYNTCLNNAYQYGATTWDSAEFASAIWRSGWTLKLAPVFGDTSFFVFHSSPIQYIPNLISYVFTGDRITYYGLVYGVIYGAMFFSVFTLLAANMPSWFGTLVAVVGAAALFCSQIVVGGSWEMRIDFAAPLFAILAFSAWQLRHYKLAGLWLVLNAGVREDIGVIFAIPLFMLVIVQWWSLRVSDAPLARERLRWGVALVLLSVLTAVASYTAQTTYFNVFDQVNASYYSLNDPLGHITEDMLARRASHIFYNLPGVWLPLCVLFAAAIAFADMRLMVGVFGFFPYLLAMIFSKTDISGMLLSYKPFPLMLSMVWPAIIALEKIPQMKRRYMVLQCIVLASGLTYFSEALPRALYYRWTPNPLTENAHLYRRFGEKVLDKENPFSGHVRASHGIIALYPYQFPLWWDSNVGMMKPEEEEKIETLIWFEGDRDGDGVQEILNKGNFARSMIPGTQIMIGRRVHGEDGTPRDPREVSVEPLP